MKEDLKRSMRYRAPAQAKGALELSEFDPSVR